MITTTQQTSLALGVATLGTLFAALSTSSMESALVITTAVQALLIGGIAVAANRLPDPRG
jgi:hypothetical protein